MDMMPSNTTQSALLARIPAHGPEGPGAEQREWPAPFEACQLRVRIGSVQLTQASAEAATRVDDARTAGQRYRCGQAAQRGRAAIVPRVRGGTNAMAGSAARVRELGDLP
jgi:hypothetical protein